MRAQFILHLQRIDFQLGSVHNFLPRDVIEEMWRTWLGHNCFERLPDLNGKEPEPFCAKRGLSFERCDLIFELLGSDNKSVSHRCDAQNFLSSPWTTDGPRDAKICLINMPKSIKQNGPPIEPTYILGMVSAFSTSVTVTMRPKVRGNPDVGS